MTVPHRPIQLAIANDYALVVEGLLSMLAPYADRVTVVALSTGAALALDVDVVLFDTFAHPQDDARLDELVGSSARVVVYGWESTPARVAALVTRGAAGFLFKSGSADDVVAAVEAVHAGEIVTSFGAGVAMEAWPGGADGLSPREAEVLALIVQGLSNREIAARLFLSVNSVKSYVRVAYRKIRVTRRSHAVVWGIAAGLRLPEAPGVLDASLTHRSPPGVKLL